jgi:hypothetical protein
VEVAAPFLAGAALVTGVVCDHTAEHTAETSKRVEKTMRMKAPSLSSSARRTAGGGRPTWFLITAKYDFTLES